VFHEGKYQRVKVAEHPIQSDIYFTGNIQIQEEQDNSDTFNGYNDYIHIYFADFVYDGKNTRRSFPQIIKSTNILIMFSIQF
jgi:hypothetical protein